MFCFTLSLRYQEFSEIFRSQRYNPIPHAADVTTADSLSKYPKDALRPLLSCTCVTLLLYRDEGVALASHL